MYEISPGRTTIDTALSMPSFGFDTSIRCRELAYIVQTSCPPLDIDLAPASRSRNKHGGFCVVFGAMPLALGSRKRPIRRREMIELVISVGKSKYIVRPD